MHPLIAEQGFVPCIIVYHQLTLPVLHKLSGMSGTATGLVIEDNNSGSRLQIVTAVGPKVSLLGFALAWVQLRHWRFIG